ncbi:MAG: hypothetical protein AAF387_01680 [Pseudomonadota bacterium]
MDVINLESYRAAKQKKLDERSAPVKPHDPADRILLARLTACELTPRLSTWEVRSFDCAGPFHLYFTKHDMLHLQLWNPYFGISLLSPSKITADRFEAFPISGWKVASKSYDAISSKIESQFATKLPELSRVQEIGANYWIAPDQTHPAQRNTTAET